MPMAGLTGSDLPAAAGWQRVADPYTGQEWVAIPAIRPDWAIVHASCADSFGNARLGGARYDDVLLARAARRVLVTCEEVVAREELAAAPERTDLTGLNVAAVVAVPGGARPFACAGHYEADQGFFERYLQACAQAGGFQGFVKEVLA